MPSYRLPPADDARRDAAGGGDGQLVPDLGLRRAPQKPHGATTWRLRCGVALA
jgi:hypothetical protein